jgi:hypothetical protein
VPNAARLDLFDDLEDRVEALLHFRAGRAAAYRPFDCPIMASVFACSFGDSKASVGHQAAPVVEAARRAK